MDKLPCSPSLLMSINFDGLKDVINFLHKNMNIMNEKLNDIFKKFKGFEEIQNQANENRIKTEAGLRLLGELEQSISNHSQSIIENSNRISTNKDNLEELKLYVEKIQNNNKKKSNKNKNLISNSNIDNKVDNVNAFVHDEINNDYEDDNELENEIYKIKLENKNNFEKIFQKFEELDSKINKINDKEDDESKIEINKEKIITDKEKNNNEKEKENNEKENKMESQENNVLIKDLSDRVTQIEETLKKMSDEMINDIKLPNSDKITEIKEIKSANAENNLGNKQENNYDDKLNEIENKISKLEQDFLSIQLNNFVNNETNQIPISQNQIIQDEIIHNDKIQNEKNDEINQKEEGNNESISDIKNMINNEQKKFNSLQNKIYEIVSQINELNYKISGDKILGKNEFNKYTQKLELQLKDYNDKINDILLKTSLNSDSLKKLSLINDIPKNFAQTDYKKISNNKSDALLMDTIESNTRKIIIDYLRRLDISDNPKIIKIEKDLENHNNLINESTNKLTELIQDNINNQKKEFSELLEKTKKDIESKIKNIEDKIKIIPTLKEEIDFCQGILLGGEELEKYRKMSKEERRNEMTLGTSIKEEINIHSDYLKKLSEGINKVNNRLSNLNKENLASIKKDLKNESNFILEDFKVGLKDSISKIETKLRDKVDKLGLDQFWNKINEQLLEEMKQKIDKKEMNKNNMYLKKKIDNLESKISRTLVDTLIDLQMDEAPLLVKKNFREITEQKCASCGQNLQNVSNNGILGYSLDFNNFGNNQHKAFKQKIIPEKDKLPEIKTNIQK